VGGWGGGRWGGGALSGRRICALAANNAGLRRSGARATSNPGFRDRFVSAWRAARARHVELRLRAVTVGSREPDLLFGGLDGFRMRGPQRRFALQQIALGRLCACCTVREPSFSRIWGAIVPPASQAKSNGACPGWLNLGSRALIRCGRFLGVDLASKVFDVALGLGRLRLGLSQRAD